MLVPVQGGIAQLQKRNRPILGQEEALATINLPNIYIFNVGSRPWKGVGAGREWTIPARPKGARHSVPVPVPMMIPSEVDIADGGGNMGIVMNFAASGSSKPRVEGGESRYVMGVADDVVGKNSTSPGLDLNTTNGEWFGVFVSPNEKPTEQEIVEAESKLAQMMEFIYAQGAEKVQAGEKVLMSDRRIYNEAAEYLHARPLWGNLDHTMDACPLCGEDIRKGARVCKHCNRAIDEASVQAFFLRQQRELEELMEQAPGEATAETGSAAPEATTAKKKARGKN